MLEALLLDFDGLILDTEEAEYRALAELFSASGERLEYETWRRTVGNVSLDWIAELATPGSAYYVQLRQRFRDLHNSLVQAAPTLPGVEDMLDFAGTFSVPVAVVTSATRDRLLRQLSSRGIDNRLHSTVTLEDVTAPKPAPEPYLLALEQLAVSASGTVAFEDSGHGVRSATTAGIRCVAVPNDVTRGHDFTPASLVISSLADLNLTALLGGQVVTVH